jgi:Cu+-exporting ATPase
MNSAPRLDPVCGMTVAPDAPLRHEHKGVTYLFCAESCLRRFRAEPERFLAGERAAMAPDESLASAVHICPMCDGVRSIGPASCPKCGMALEPQGVFAGDPFEHEHRLMRKRLVFAAALSTPLAIVAMGGMLVGGQHHALLDEPLNGALQAALATPVVFGAGWPILQRAAASLRARSANMFTLLALGIGAAWCASVAALFAPELGLELYFESAALVTTLALLGQVLELSARRKTGAALRELLDLAPPTALVLDPLGNERELPLAQVREGFVLRVKPGARVPVDGVVLDGEANVDEAMLTGEPLAQTKRQGDTLSAGTVLVSGSLRLLAERVGAATTLSRIVELVARAQRSRAPVQAQVDKVAAWFTPAVLVVALGAAIAWALLGGDDGLAHGLVAAISVLVVACPCALGLATPMSIVVATARAAHEGVLFRDAAALQALAQVDVLLVDKTGTLTEGRPRVVDVHAQQPFTLHEIVEAAAAVERASEHPLAAAILAHAEALGLRPDAAERFESSAGRGARGVVRGREVLVGNAAHLSERGVLGSEHAAERVAAAHADASLVFVALDGRLGGVLVVADPLRASARAARAELAADGLELQVLSGDRTPAVAAVARELGIERFEGDATPERKAQVVAELRARGRRVAMAGDGVNDAPALALADVGIAMGGGTDIAKHAAAVTLVKGDLRALARARALSRATLANIRQNLWLAFGYNALCLPLAAGALYPLTGALLSPTLAAAAMTFSSVSVIGNALRLRRVALNGPAR